MNFDLIKVINKLPGNGKGLSITPEVGHLQILQLMR